MESEIKQKGEAIYIRSDGWVFSQSGMDRLREGGRKGFERFRKSMESRLGEWHRVSKPLDRDAAAALKKVKGLVERGVFISSAIAKEARSRQSGRWSALRSEEGRGSPAEFMRLTLTDSAYETVGKMGNPEFRDFVSNAILRQRKTWSGER